MRFPVHMLLVGMFAVNLPVAGAAGYAVTIDLSPSTFPDSSPLGIVNALNSVSIDTTNAIDNTALISQSSNGLGNVAYIEQAGGVGNFAALLQDNSSYHNNAVYQTGSHNSALLYQH